MKDEELTFYLTQSLTKAQIEEAEYYWTNKMGGSFYLMQCEETKYKLVDAYWEIINNEEI